MTKDMFNSVRAGAWAFLVVARLWLFLSPNGRRFMKGLRELVMTTMEFPGEWNRMRLIRLSVEARAVYRALRLRQRKKGRPDPFRLDNGVLWLPVGR